MSYSFEFRLYRRLFQTPLQTNHSTWRVREGILVRLQDEIGRMGFGEIAPLPEFGSESLTEAIAFCQQLPSQLSLHDINAVPNELSACQFGVGMAWETMTQVAIHSPELSIVMPKSDVNICQLLPTGDAALQACKALCQIGHRTFKWKIGVAPIEQECAYLTRLARSMPFDVRIRLDANGGLNWSLANQWLALCDRLQSSQHATIELLEQPLPPSQFEQMLALSQQYATPIALDESVATLQQLQTCYDRGWRSIVVIKAAIAGFPWRLREFCQNTHIDSVWSSVFETAIAQQFILNTLIPAVPYRERSLGFGVNHWFADGMTDGTPQQLWECLNS